MSDETDGPNTIELATELTIAWLNSPNNRVSADDVSAFLQRMHSTLRSLTGGSQPGGAPEAAEAGPMPAVSVRKSLASKDHLISLIDGKPYKSLKRHLARHDLTPEQYRERYQLKPDYPMVAENYATQRRELALKIGLGSQGRAARSAKRAGAGSDDPKPPVRQRKKLALETD